MSVQKNGAKTEPRWRNPARETIYGQKLLEAIKSVNIYASSPMKPSHSRVIKDVADSALALSAGGRTRWSRAILSRQWQKRKLMMKLRGKIRRRPSQMRPVRKSAPVMSTDTTPAGNGGEERIGERLRVLSRLVPGCRKVPTPTLLEEAADYVAALQMQVRAMRTCTDRLSVAALTQTQN